MGMGMQVSKKKRKNRKKKHISGILAYTYSKINFFFSFFFFFFFFFLFFFFFFFFVFVCLCVLCPASIFIMGCTHTHINELIETLTHIFVCVDSILFSSFLCLFACRSRVQPQYSYGLRAIKSVLSRAGEISTHTHT